MGMVAVRPARPVLVPLSGTPWQRQPLISSRHKRLKLQAAAQAASAGRKTPSSLQKVPRPLRGSPAGPAVALKWHGVVLATPWTAAGDEAIGDAVRRAAALIANATVAEMVPLLLAMHAESSGNAARASQAVG